jgi:hypothetical protein
LEQQKKQLVEKRPFVTPCAARIRPGMAGVPQEGLAKEMTRPNLAASRPANACRNE